MRASVLCVLRNMPRAIRTTQRTATSANTSDTAAVAAAAHGCAVTSHKSPIAAASSPVLSATFETGSGLGVTAARTAVFDPCASAKSLHTGHKYQPHEYFRREFREEKQNARACQFRLVWLCLAQIGTKRLEVLSVKARDMGE